MADSFPARNLDQAERFLIVQRLMYYAIETDPRAHADARRRDAQKDIERGFRAAFNAGVPRQSL